MEFSDDDIFCEMPKGHGSIRKIIVDGEVLRVFMSDSQEFEVNKRGEVTAVYRFKFQRYKTVRIRS